MKQKDIIGIRCTDNRYKEPNLHRYGPGSREVYALHYVISGSGTVIMKGCEHDVKQGEAFLVFPYTEVEYGPIEEDPWEYIWVDFYGSDTDQLIKQTGFTKETPVMKCPLGVKKHFQIFEYCAPQFVRQERYAAKVRLLLTYFFEEKNVGKRPVSDVYIDTVLEYIENNYWRSEVNVTDIVEHLNIERTYLFRLFKKKVGINMVNYLRGFRIQKACGLLRTTDMSIQVIAYSVGFEDALYFSRIFKKVNGVTPRDYRKSVQLPLSL